MTTNPKAYEIKAGEQTYQEDSWQDARLLADHLCGNGYDRVTVYSESGAKLVTYHRFEGQTIRTY